MPIAERELGLYGLIKKQRQENQRNKDLMETKWKLYGDRQQKGESTFMQTRRMLNGYQQDFRGVLYGIPIADFISEKHDAVMIDIMSPTDILAELFLQDKMRDKKLLGIAVSFEDHRNKAKKIRDKSLNIHQIKGDVMDNVTWKRVEKRLRGRKADLIMERAEGGLSGIPDHPTFFAAMLVKVWQLLSQEGGIFVGQAYYFNQIFAEQLTEYFQKSNINALIEGRMVRLIKTHSSPEDIDPILRRLPKLTSNPHVYGYVLK